MTFTTKTVAALLVSASVPLLAGQATAASIKPLGVSNSDVSSVEQVQWRRGWRSGRWVGPAIGFGAGVAIGSALAPRYYYDEPYAYGYAPGYYSYGYAPGYSYGYYGRQRCSGEEGYDSSFAYC